MATRRSHPPPKVTGLSPKEGPPGTKVTVRGENLGTSPEDLLGLIICGVDCFMYSEWVSPSKILTRSGRCRGLGDVIVATRSGGIGSCTVQYRGYEESVSLTKESAVWVNEDELVTAGPARNRSTSSPTLMIGDPLGLPVQDVPVQDMTDSDGPAKSAEITSVDFNPAVYLVQKHNSATFGELKKGLRHLRGTSVGGSNHSGPNPVALLKPNVLAVVECLDALKNVNTAVKKDQKEQKEFGSDLTFKIEDLLKKITGDAHQIFDAILATKDLSDSTRNALNVLQRYRFLFNLPSSIESNIQRGDFDSVINDYSRGRSLFEDTQVKVFKKVYFEVEQRIERFKKVLEEKLKTAAREPDSRSFDQLKKLIRHCVSLGTNPAWNVVVTMKETLEKRLNDCHEKYKSAVPAESVPSGADMSPETPQTVLFIEELITIFRKFYPDLVKLGREYLDGNLFSKDSDEEMRRKEAIFEAEMIDEMIKKLVQLMRSALIPSSKSSGFCFSSERSSRTVIWLPHCLRCVTECHQYLMRQELLSSSSLQPLQQLTFDFRVHSLAFLMNQAADEIRVMNSKETWDVMTDNSIGSRTQLPLLFESKVSEIVQLIRETVVAPSNSDDADIFSQINVQGQVKQLSQNLLQSFVTALERTLPEKASSHYDERTLMVISNCSFTSVHSLPRIQETFEKHNYPDMSMVIKVSQAKCKDLENKLIKSFTETKCDYVIGCIEPAMYAQSTEWFAPSTRPTDVSYYVKDTLMNLIQVEAQIFAVAPVLVKKVLVDVIDAAIEEISRLQECVTDRFNEYGNMQAVVDFMALKMAFRDIESLSTERLIDASCTHLKPMSRGADRESVDKVIQQLKLSMQLQLFCFRWESDQTVIAI